MKFCTHDHFEVKMPDIFLCVSISSLQNYVPLDKHTGCYIRVFEAETFTILFGLVDMIPISV